MATTKSPNENCLQLPLAFGTAVAVCLGANTVVRSFNYVSRLTIVVIICALTASAVCAQTNPQLTVDELVAKNVAAKGGADALRALQSVRLTGKLLVNEGQIQLAYVETKKRPGEIRTEVTLQGMTAIRLTMARKAGRSPRSRAGRIRRKCRPTKPSR